MILERGKMKTMLIDAETVIVNLLAEDKKTYLELSRFEELCCYIRDQLIEYNSVNGGYHLLFDVNYSAIERTVEYNSEVFALIGNRIYLRRNLTDDILRRYRANEILQSYITKFIDRAAA
jgi:hypothetical protein